MNKYPTLLLMLIAVLATACTKGAKNEVMPTVPITTVPTPVNITSTIVILGSSTAQGFGASCADSSWAKKLQVAVNKNMKANFVNLAYGGYTTYNILPNGYNFNGKPSPDTARNITKALSYKPTLVLISLPNNDVAANYNNKEIVGNFQKLTHLLDSARIQYIIFGTQPRDFTIAAERMQLKSLNDTLKSVYTNHMDDFLEALSTQNYSIKPGLEYGDGIHLNNTGHTVIFNSILQHPLLSKQLAQ